MQLQGNTGRLCLRYIAGSRNMKQHVFVLVNQYYFSDILAYCRFGFEHSPLINCIFQKIYIKVIYILFIFRASHLYSSGVN